MRPLYTVKMFSYCSSAIHSRCMCKRKKKKKKKERELLPSFERQTNEAMNKIDTARDSSIAFQLHDVRNASSRGTSINESFDSFGDSWIIQASPELCRARSRNFAINRFSRVMLVNRRT